MPDGILRERYSRMKREQMKYRVAIRNDVKGTITYRKSTLPHLLKFLLEQTNGVLDLDRDDRVYITPADHHMPWEIPEEELRDANTKIQY